MKKGDEKIRGGDEWIYKIKKKKVRKYKEKEGGREKEDLVNIDKIGKIERKKWRRRKIRKYEI